MSLAFDEPADLRAHYRAVRKRLHATPAPKPAPAAPVQPLPTPIHVIRTAGRDILVISSVSIIYPYPIGPKSEKTNRDIANRIMFQACAKHGFGPRDVRSLRREAALVACRQEICWQIKKETSWSLPQIGRFLGGRDHTTILHSIRRHEGRIAEGKL